MPVAQTFAEAQEEMYELTQTYHEMVEIEKALSKKIDAIMEKRRKLFYEFPMIDIHQKKK